MLARICFGWAVVLGGPIDTGFGQKGYMLKLTENSFSPGTEILFYPEELIREFEEV